MIGYPCDSAVADTREPWPHPWAALLPLGWVLERASLETGDFCLALHPGGVVIERKTPSDLAACIGTCRERFETRTESRRYVGRLAVVVEGSLSDVAVAAPKHSPQRSAGYARRPGRCAFVRLFLPAASASLRILPFACSLPNSLPRSAAGLSPGERSAQAAALRAQPGRLRWKSARHHFDRESMNLFPPMINSPPWKRRAPSGATQDGAPKQGALRTATTCHFVGPHPKLRASVFAASPVARAVRLLPRLRRPSVSASP